MSKLTSKEDRAHYMNHLLKDLQALQMMLEGDQIDKYTIRIGAEQEFCLTNKRFMPFNIGLEVLDILNDSDFTTEIGSYNLELNLNPLELRSSCFSLLHDQMKGKLGKAQKAAESLGGNIVLTGILPTLSTKHISLENMTPVPRYSVLNEAIKESRKQDFMIHIRGADEFNLMHDSVMLEGCNTSFQMHLQVSPDEFVDSYNWAQTISAPVLAAATNSPLLFGKELWAETRIALFSQSIDTRARSNLLNHKHSRVSFGNDWHKGNVVDIFKENVFGYRSLLTSEYLRDSVELLNNNETPRLKALNLHNGTVYRWNRPCYGVFNDKPHLRIENRYIPSGPTLKDEIANMVFWIGLMMGRPKDMNEITSNWHYKDVKNNFYAAARYGLATQMRWDNKLVAVDQLILNELLPIAYKGLIRSNVDKDEADFYLSIIERRIAYNTGSTWITKSFRNLLKKHKAYKASQLLTSFMFEKQRMDYPVGRWAVLDISQTKDFEVPDEIKNHMSFSVFTADLTDSLQFAHDIMEWKNIHHLPIINCDQQLIGLLSWTDIQDLDDAQLRNYSIEDYMVENPITITEYETIEQAKSLMELNNFHSLPVLRNDKLVGIITSRDFPK
ncbi:CBS domain-containing protein [Aegicerativicinus sediminis]|uniref:CBS domain-containing protein n=1 Tax=Aegicerativicinus sediminis TaxID=2893202 RepID=UPI001E56D04D|nr:CBS domain-containing protein [Aegicerativicinus sediminis]